MRCRRRTSDSRQHFYISSFSSYNHNYYRGSVSSYFLIKQAVRTLRVSNRYVRPCTFARVVNSIVKRIIQSHVDNLGRFFRRQHGRVCAGARRVPGKRILDKVSESSSGSERYENCKMHLLRSTLGKVKNQLRALSRIDMRTAAAIGIRLLAAISCGSRVGSPRRRRIRVPQCTAVTVSLACVSREQRKLGCDIGARWLRSVNKTFTVACNKCFTTRQTVATRCHI